MVSFIEQEKEEKSLVKRNTFRIQLAFQLQKLFFPSLLFLMEQKKKTLISG